MHYDPQLDLYSRLMMNRRRNQSFGCYATLMFVMGFGGTIIWYMS